MTAPCISTCSVWATEDDLCSPCLGASINSDELDSALATASDILFELSGQQFPGSCREVIRPCTNQPNVFYNWRSPWSWTTNSMFWQASPWTWFSGCGCNMDDGCGCSTLATVNMPYYPTTGINSVKVDGVTLDPTLYRVDDFRYLVRLNDPDGSNPGWPCCQDLHLPSTEPNTFEIDFSYGRTPPPAGVRAAAVLACELVLACNPGLGACRLPRNVSSIARQGVSVIFERLTRVTGHFRFGLWEVDTFLEAYAPNGPTPKSIVASPDTINRAKRVGT